MPRIRFVKITFLIVSSESMNWTNFGGAINVIPLVGVCIQRHKSDLPAESEPHYMKKTYGVCVGLFAMGLAVLGAPVSRAAGDPATETTAANSPAAPAASSPADLDRRIEALEMELTDLKAALAEKKEAESAAVVPGVVAQDAAKPAEPEKVTVASLLGPTSLSGFIDTYYQTNFNHPAGELTALRSFDYRDKSINLNMIELILDKAPDATMGRTGYHVSLGYGDAMSAIDATERASSGFGNNAPGFDQFVKEAYFSYLAPVGTGLQVDVGKFVTPMGAEVIESKDNWNYSRSILFSYAIPYFHFGARAKYTFNSKYALTGFLVNGWNNVVDNNELRLDSHQGNNRYAHLSGGS
jgi:hypothetical protein